MSSNDALRSPALQSFQTLTLGRAIALAWHLSSLFVLTYALGRLPVHSAISGFNIEDQFGSHYQFLTVLGLWFSRLTMLFAISADLTPTSGALRRIKTVLSATSMPAEVLISMLYWPILLLDPELLIPPRKVVDPANPAQFIWETIRLPLLDDLSFHAAPAVILLVDYILFSPPFIFRENHPILISTLSTAAYGIWVEICHAKNGTYPYPLMAVLTNVQRIGLYVVCAFVFVIITVSATILHKSIDRLFARQWDTLQGVQGVGITGKIDKTAHSSQAKKNK